MRNSLHRRLILAGAALLTATSPALAQAPATPQTQPPDRQPALLQGDVAQQENQIRAQQQELVRQQPNLSAEQFNTRRRTIEQRIGELERSVQERRRVLDQSFGEAMNQFQGRTSEIIGE